MRCRRFSKRGTAWRTEMPDRKTIEKAQRDKREGKSPSTQAGEFVHEEIKKIRRGEHGARSTSRRSPSAFLRRGTLVSICRQTT